MNSSLVSSRRNTLAAAVVAATMAACGGGQPQSTSTPPPMAPAGGSPAATAAGGGAVTLDTGLPEYQPTSGISGNLSSVGSDTMNNLMTLWGETFSRSYPNVRLQVEGK